MSLDDTKAVLILAAKTLENVKKSIVEIREDSEISSAGKVFLKSVATQAEDLASSLRAFACHTTGGGHKIVSREEYDEMIVDEVTAFREPSDTLTDEEEDALGEILNKIAGDNEVTDV